MVAQKSPVTQIWMLSREFGSLAGAGGVKDVVYQLSKALARWNRRSVHVVLPCYGFMDPALHGFTRLPDPLVPEKHLKLSVDMNLPTGEAEEEVSFFYCRQERVHVYLVAADRFSDKNAVYTYTAEDEAKSGWKKTGFGHHDYFAMNVLLQKSALELMVALGEKPDVIHCHDGHTALTSAMIRETPGYKAYFRGTGCVTTIHNAGYGYHQEIADIPYALSITGLLEETILNNQLEDKFDPLLVAGAFGLVNTVSENYADELQNSDHDQLTGWLGHELAKRGVTLEGITNGIDPQDFSSRIENVEEEQRFDPGAIEDDLAGKKKCKTSFQAKLEHHEAVGNIEKYGSLTSIDDSVLFTFIGRLSGQKGVDVLLEVLPVFLAQNSGAQIAVLGSGEKELEAALVHLAGDERFSGRVCYLQGFDPRLAKRVYAAGDYFVIPSQFEPCGLTDFIAQLYGNIPVVHHVGGLVKVKDGATGLAYHGEEPEDLLHALNRALQLEHDPEKKRQIQFQAVQTIDKQYTWSKVMHSYVELYLKSKKHQLRGLGSN